MSSLSQYHPFRDNINKSATSEVAPAVSQGDTKDSSAEQEFKPWLSFKAKMRVVVFTVVVLALWYVISSFFQENPDLEEGFYKSVNNIQKKSHAKSLESPQNIFDEHDLDDRGRSISDTNSKVGFFNRIFCKGGKRASFCD